MWFSPCCVAKCRGRKFASDTSGQVPSGQFGVQVQAGSVDTSNAHYCREKTGDGRVRVFHAGGPPPLAHPQGLA